MSERHNASSSQNSLEHVMTQLEARLPYKKVRIPMLSNNEINILAQNIPGIVPSDINLKHGTPTLRVEHVPPRHRGETGETIVHGIPRGIDIVPVTVETRLNGKVHRTWSSSFFQTALEDPFVTPEQRRLIEISQDNKDPLPIAIIAHNGIPDSLKNLFRQYVHSKYQGLTSIGQIEVYKSLLEIDRKMAEGLGSFTIEPEIQEMLLHAHELVQFVPLTDDENINAAFK